MGRGTVSSAAKGGREGRDGGGADGVAIGLFLVGVSGDCASYDGTTVDPFVVHPSEVAQKGYADIVFLRRTMGLQEILTPLFEIGGMLPLLPMLLVVEA